MKKKVALNLIIVGLMSEQMCYGMHSSLPSTPPLSHASKSRQSQPEQQDRGLANILQPIQKHIVVAHQRDLPETSYRKRNLSDSVRNTSTKNIDSEEAENPRLSVSTLINHFEPNKKSAFKEIPSNRSSVSENPQNNDHLAEPGHVARTIQIAPLVNHSDRTLRTSDTVLTPLNIDASITENTNVNNTDEFNAIKNATKPYTRNAAQRALASTRSVASRLVPARFKQSATNTTAQVSFEPRTLPTDPRPVADLNQSITTHKETIKNLFEDLTKDNLRSTQTTIKNFYTNYVPETVISELKTLSEQENENPLTEKFNGLNTNPSYEANDGNTVTVLGPVPVTRQQRIDNQRDIQTLLQDINDRLALAENIKVLGDMKKVVNSGNAPQTEIDNETVLENAIRKLNPMAAQLKSQLNTMGALKDKTVQKTVNAYNAVASKIAQHSKIIGKSIVTLAVLGSVGWLLADLLTGSTE